MPSAPSSTAATPLEPSTVQFRLRSLFIATAVVAGGAALLGVVVRRLPADEQNRFILYWALFSTTVVATGAYSAWRRQRAVTNAGDVLLRLRPHSYLVPKSPKFGRVVSVLFLLGWVLGMWALGSSSLIGGGNIRQSIWSTAVSCVLYSTFMLIMGLGHLLWGRTIWVCNQGVVVQTTFLPWGKCRRWYWDACYRDVLVIEAERHARIAATVPSDEREGLEALFREELAA